MKTYSRKKSEAEDQEEEVILDLNELCRLCMNKENDLIPIFSHEDSVPLTLRIMACVALEVFEGDGLPNKICHPCKYELGKFYTFRKKCELSDTKLRQLVRSVQQERGKEPLDVNSETEDGQERVMEIDTSMEEEDSCEPTSIEEHTTEADLVGVTQVAYITANEHEADDPENITLSSEAEQINKDAVTLKTDPDENELEDGEGMYIIGEAGEEQQVLDDNNLDAIADAVKATLASQPGLNLGNQLQLKVNSSEGKSTQVEVTTEDGSVIVMELTTEDTNDLLESMPSKANDDGELPIFKCPDCPKSFSRRIQLRRHASVHMQQRGFSCGICEKWFPTRSALVRHERIHTGERPFQCEVCQKSFAQKEILFRHLMTHTGQKPYNCPHCPKGFTQKEPLRVHMRSHVINSESDIQLHYCTLCPKVFCHASGLSRHLVTHTGKTFKCQDCERAFTDKSSLRRHHRQTGHQM